MAFFTLSLISRTILHSFHSFNVHGVTFRSIFLFLETDLLHNFSPFAAIFAKWKKLFIKYAGCCYSIKDWSTCQNRYHLLLLGLLLPLSLSFPFTLCSCYTIAFRHQIDAQMKSTCTYWLGTHWNYYQWWFCKFFLIRVRSVLCTQFIRMIWNANWLLLASSYYIAKLSFATSVLCASFMRSWSFGLFWFFVICFLIINPPINYYCEKYPIVVRPNISSLQF